MKMRSFILAAVFTASSVCVFAQKGEVSSAKTNYDKFIVLKDANSMMLATPSLKNAKASIDKAVVHEKTKSDPTAWTYKALIYGQLALMDTVATTSLPLMDQSKTAYKQATALDTEGANKEKLNELSAIFSQYELNTGVKAYQGNKFEEAYSAFNNAL